MSQAIKYLESVSYTDLKDEDINDAIETVTINEAITACKIQELETLRKIKEHSVSNKIPFILEIIEGKIQHLEKELRNLKIK